MKKKISTFVLMLNLKLTMLKNNFLSMEKGKLIKFIIFCILILALLPVSLYQISNKLNKREINNEQYEMGSDSLIIKSDFIKNYDLIAGYLHKYRIKHPHIVMAQFIIESDYFKSPIAVDNHNLCGMKFPGQRATLATGISRGHAVFESWEHCVIDYAIYQASSRTHTITDEEYLQLLIKRRYAEDQAYVDKVRVLSNRIRNGKIFKEIK